jgi:hypothetical protein
LPTEPTPSAEEVVTYMSTDTTAEADLRCEILPPVTKGWIAQG